MRRRRGAGEGPISLFSFQDVITAITGIMILVVMILVLDVVNRKAIEASAPGGESVSMPALRQELAELEAQKETLSEDLRKLKTTTAQLLSDNPAELAEDIAKAQRDAEDLSESIEQLQAKIAAQRKALGSRAASAPEEAEIETLRRQLAKIERENRITFEFTQSKKTPILVQCSQAGIKARSMAAKPETRVFSAGAPAGPAGSIVQFETWAEGLPRDGNAFVVLVKPSAAPYASKVIEALREKKFDVGYEPLEESMTPAFSDGSTF